MKHKIRTEKINYFETPIYSCGIKTLSVFRSITTYSYLACKRIMDIVFSIILLILTSPLVLYIFLYIKRRSNGPAIFRQVRIKNDRRKRPKLEVNKYFRHPITDVLTVDSRIRNDVYRSVEEERRKNGEDLTYRDGSSGQHLSERRKNNMRGEPFVFYKFTTMYSDARERFPELYKYKYSKVEVNKIRFKLDDDPRVPPWARWLRKSSMDELPNFFNVLKGDMSLVGPRPDIPEMVQYYSYAQHAVKLSAKPGITGLAQIKGRGDLTFQETLALDLEYVRRRSLFLDIIILLETFLKLFTGKDEAY